MKTKKKLAKERDLGLVLLVVYGAILTSVIAAYVIMMTKYLINLI